MDCKSSKMLRCILCLCWAVVATGQTNPVVDTSVGQIVGVKDDIIKFLGIPYAVVDEKDPFGPAKPQPYFDKPYLADRDPVVCPQIFKGVLQGNIQCLHLNIYKPIKENHKKPYPVMVFIHGGAFQEGDGRMRTYGPRLLIKHDILVISVLYRLGPYGFLCLDEEDYNNQGLKDQDLALKWIKKNVKQFGGDENNITLFGHSAGAAAVEYHLLNDEDKVFNKIIMQSLTLTSPLIIDTPKDYKYLVETASRLGIDGKDLKTVDLMKQLANISTDIVISATINDAFRPCFKGLVIKDDHKRNNLKDMKIIVGNTEREAILSYKDVTNFTGVLEAELRKHFYNLSEKDVANVEKFYSNSDLKEDVIDFLCDFIYNYPLLRAVRHYMLNNVTVYRYLFSQDGKRNYVKVRDGIKAKYATHGDELGYLFDSDVVKDFSEDEQSVINTITTFWTNFAKYGDPTPEYLSETTWPKVDDSEFFMNIGRTAKLERSYRKKQMEFWDRFYKDSGLIPSGIRYEEEYILNNKASQSYVLLYLFVASVVIICII